MSELIVNGFDFSDDVKKEFRVDDKGRGYSTIRGTARMFKVSPSTLSENFSDRLNPSKLAEKLIMQGFEVLGFPETGIPDTALTIIADYYAFESRQASQETKDATTSFIRVTSAIGVRTWIQHELGWKKQEEPPEWIKGLLSQSQLLIETQQQLLVEKEKLITEKEKVIGLLESSNQEKEIKITNLELVVDHYKDDESKRNQVYFDFPGLEVAVEFAKTYQGVETFKSLKEYCSDIGMQISTGQKIQVGQLISAFIKLSKLEQPIKNKGKTLYSSKFFPLLNLALEFILQDL